LRDAGQWVGRLEQTGQGQLFHLCLRLNEPSSARQEDGDEVAIAAPNELPWLLSLHLQSAEDPGYIIDAADIWSHAPLRARSNGATVDQPQELLLSELGRASRLYSKIESALSEASPSDIQLT